MARRRLLRPALALLGLAAGALAACGTAGERSVNAQPAKEAKAGAPVVNGAPAADAQSAVTSGAVKSSAAAKAPWHPKAVSVVPGPAKVVANPRAKETDPWVIVAEGEFFKVQDKKGWQVVEQDDSYASHTYGGMWVHNGALMGAPADSEGSIAIQNIEVPAAGEYRVWSKYQAPPYFNYLHKVEVYQGGKSVYSHVYGDVKAERFYSFAAAYKSKPIQQLWWFWGVDHDAAEAPKTFAKLNAGAAEVRITTVSNPAPAGDRFVDFVVLTTEKEDKYEGYSPAGISSPFMLEAIRGEQVFARFKNPLGVASKLAARAAGHLQPIYSGKSGQFPDAEVAGGQWSPWFNIAQVSRLAHDEGIWVSLSAGKSENAIIEMEFARDAGGSDKVGSVKVVNGEAIVLPIDIIWNKNAKVQASRDHAMSIIEASKKTWRSANGGKKPALIPYYGSFNAPYPWVAQLKDALGYNTQLPAGFEKIQKDGYHQHTHSPGEIENFVKNLTPEQKANFRILSFGDEIHLGEINYADAANQPKFQAWLKAKGYTAADLGGTDPASATMTKDESKPELAWYSKLFSAEERFQYYAEMTRMAERLLNKDVLTGANYSPHGAPQYYGHLDQWIDIFKFRGMSAYWTEDYIFSVPEPPQMIGWMLANARCAVKYHNLPIHFYVMPHAPGQTAENLRRGMVYAVGAGATQIDSFWVAPPENYTENFIAWSYPDSFKAVHESIYDSGEVEQIAVGGRYRSSRVALILGRATDFNEPRVKVTPKDDPFAALCQMDFGGFQQTLCRKDAHGLYLALRQAQHGVDLITEEDITDPKLDILKNYDVVYYAGEWCDTHTVKKLDAWVKNGGTLYATAGLGHLNQFNKPEQSLLNLLGLKSVTIAKNAYHIRPLLELPLLKPIDTITLNGEAVPAIAMKQVLTPGDAKVIGTWSDKSAAVTVREYGKGKAIAVGTLPGHSYIKAGNVVTAWARGGRRMVYNPVAMGTPAGKLALLGVDGKDAVRNVVASDALVEGMVIDNAKGSVVTLVNWNDAPLKGVDVTVQLPYKPSSVRSVQQQKSIPVTYADGKATLKVDLTEADYLVFNR